MRVKPLGINCPSQTGPVLFRRETRALLEGCSSPECFLMAPFPQCSWLSGTEPGGKPKPSCFSALGTSGPAVLTPRQEHNLPPVPVPTEADPSYANMNGAGGSSLEAIRAQGWGEEPAWSRCHQTKAKGRQGCDKGVGTPSGAPLRKRLLVFSLNCFLIEFKV